MYVFYVTIILVTSEDGLNHHLLYFTVGTRQSQQVQVCKEEEVAKSHENSNCVNQNLYWVLFLRLPPSTFFLPRTVAILGSILIKKD